MRRRLRAEHYAMKKPKHWSQPITRQHVPADDRARTASGKTASRKVRNEGRHLAALERSAEVKHAYEARRVMARHATTPSPSAGR